MRTCSDYEQRPGEPRPLGAVWPMPRVWATGSGFPIVPYGRDGGRASAPAARSPRPSPPITLREREVLCLVAQGLSNKLVAGRLCITERTVKSHLTNIMSKLEACDRTHAVVTAIRLGLIAV